jgi:hypothetical protein
MPCEVAFLISQHLAVMSETNKPGVLQISCSFGALEPWRRSLGNRVPSVVQPKATLTCSYVTPVSGRTTCNASTFLARWCPTGPGTVICAMRCSPTWRSSVGLTIAFCFLAFGNHTMLGIPLFWLITFTGKKLLCLRTDNNFLLDNPIALPTHLRRRRTPLLQCSPPTLRKRCVVVCVQKHVLCVCTPRCQVGISCVCSFALGIGGGWQCFPSNIDGPLWVHTRLLQGNPKVLGFSNTRSIQSYGGPHGKVNMCWDSQRLCLSILRYRKTICH